MGAHLSSLPRIQPVSCDREMCGGEACMCLPQDCGGVDGQAAHHSVENAAWEEWHTRLAALPCHTNNKQGLRSS